jgi:uncharacterized membrane protein YhaH (DUF805 family)
MAKEMGDIVRFEPAPQPFWAAVLIVLLMLVTVVNALLFVMGIQLGWNRPVEDQTRLGIILGNVFLGLTLILVLYRRFFIDDILVVKKRHPKYEDFLEKYDIE